MNTDSNSLRDALVLLSLSEADQRRLNGPGCLSCDLYEDYRSAWDAMRRDTTQHFDCEQRHSLESIYEALGTLPEIDCECVAPDAMRLPVWEALRKQACLTLRLIGWQDPVVQPFSELSPGVWKRTLNE